MGGRVGIIILFVLVASWACDARNFMATDLLARDAEGLDVLQTSHLGSEMGSINSEGVRRNEKLCLLCEEYVDEALTYLAENKTQAEVISFLHKSCSKLQSLKQQCIMLVDYYAPLFFLEVSSVEPGTFCQKVDLCEEVVSYSQRLSENSCGLCQQAVAEVILKLKDPDTQLDILELLLKGCDAVKSYSKKCKKLVFEYAPLILANAEQFLEKTDLCKAVHACDSSAAVIQETLPSGTPTLISKF